MELKETLQVVSEMHLAGVIGRYAIGGAVGAIFYLEPFGTQDVDFFVALPRSSEGALLNLGPIYDYLLARGYQTRGEYIIINGWPVQFVPPGNPLVEEALAEAVEHDVEGLKTPVFTAEYLAAICLDVGRSKDNLRLLKFVEDGVIDVTKFNVIVERHGLLAKWREFEKKFFTR